MRVLDVCMCGAECEDWVHVLVEWGLYADLSAIGVRINCDGTVDACAVTERNAFV